ncbi:MULTISPECIES: isoprenyl transferase [Streptomyces]|uniref:Isoprenyl transferase n=1 Tax=Streptomyces evansiae TaxID=3075535 RepID=A0ABU2R3D5_9ACTN|nr:MULTISPECIES: isoprenyl transferase [unclassified Streptomyces]EFK99633.1 di-trans,poly-cis-decaprenylcistransferase [Streptomyces sp. SPB78]MDT0411145.1 isoprenyl transferase [Streptomyces sp. DSM 41979]MDT0422758.1 isoprenyl transferase [Streptomyces sp. DSM 41859]MYQ59328.1 isoprenyl transferase [Streptomyces sp. SID4926]NJA59311.1 isoprenyl transferase [Streptomyces sp. NEAU-H3]
MAVRGILGRRRREYRTPDPHPSGAVPPKLPAELVPGHVAVVMDGNGRWAKERGLPRTEGHKVGETVVMDAMKGCLELGIKNISLYAFSTENWKRSPEEVRFLMNFNRDVIARRRDEMDELGIRIRWVGRMPKLWKSVVKELQIAQEQTKDNDALTLYFCVNYGGRAEIADAARRLAEDVAAGRLDPSKVSEKTFQDYLYYPDMPDVDLFLRPSGEQRTSNFLLWQSSYAEMVYQDVLWPDFDRRDLWRACVEYAKRDRRFGGAVPNEQLLAMEEGMRGRA